MCVKKIFIEIDELIVEAEIYKAITPDTKLDWIEEQEKVNRKEIDFF